MSSILKALKKLENQAADQNHVPFWRPKSHIQNDSHGQLDDHLRLKKRYVIIFAVLVFAVGTGLILNLKLYEKKSKLIAKKEELLHKPVRFPEKKTAVIPNKNAIPQKSVRLPKKKMATPDKKAILSQPVRPPEKKGVMPDTAQNKMSSRKGVKTTEPIGKESKSMSLSVHNSRRNTAVLSNKKTSSLKQVRKETDVEKRIEKPDQHTKTDRFASIPVKRSNQTKIDLQAIAWSNDPKSRLAVINGLILRERESIDNVMVMHIGKDAVVFRQGREEWKQMFGF